jgi:hypothetical protein
MSRATRPRSVTPRVAGSGGSLSPATSDAGRSSIPRPASLTLRLSPRRRHPNLPSGMQRAIEAAWALSDRCLACGKPIRPREKQLRVRGALLHHACGTYHPRRK